ncbi:MAG: DUF1328 domain-containing protein [Methylobacteriaceae bacterium]|nr:DUF1328 domain-containing protein [Methylobacteriaceae bacterium]
MLKWALIFFVVSLVAGFLGFSGISAGAATISKWLFFIALAIFALFLILGLLAGEAIFRRSFTPRAGPPGRRGSAG